MNSENLMLYAVQSGFSTEELDEELLHKLKNFYAIIKDRKVLYDGIYGIEKLVMED